MKLYSVTDGYIDYLKSEDGVKHIKKDSFLLFRIISQKKEKKELRGTIRFANMIPVPDGELELYDVDGETDTNYKNLVIEEIMYIRKHAGFFFNC